MSLLPDLNKKMQDRIAERRFELKRVISRLEGQEGEEATGERERAVAELAELDRLITLAIEQRSASATKQLDEMLH